MNNVTVLLIKVERECDIVTATILYEINPFILTILKHNNYS